MINKDEVKDLHDLHIWAMSTTENALSVHLVLKEEKADDKFLKKLKEELHERFEIMHTTIQLEQDRLDDSLEME